MHVCEHAQMCGCKRFTPGTLFDPLSSYDIGNIETGFLESRAYHILLVLGS